MDQKFYVNQLVMLIEADLLNRDDKILLQRLKVLWQKLGEIKQVKMAVAS
jgi:hypothetical protein